MHAGRICIAGVDGHDRCIRPVVDGGNLWEEDLAPRPGVAIRAFSIVSVELGEARPDPPHTEDCVFNRYAMEFVSQLDRDEARRLLSRIADPDVSAIFGVPVEHDGGAHVQRGQGRRSLGTVRARRVVADRLRVGEGGRARAWLSVTDASGLEQPLPVTDLAFMRWCDELIGGCRPVADCLAAMDRALDGPEVYLRIGLSRNWDKHPDRCYLQITGVYPFRESGPRV
jgi:hypothetical protein